MVRVVFVLLALSGGLGIAAYVVAWLFIPLEGDDATIAARAASDRRGLTVAVAAVPLLVILVLVSSALGASWVNSFFWSLVISAAGLLLIWRNATPPEQVLLHQAVAPLTSKLETSGTPHRHLRFRLLLGLALLTGGFVMLVVHDTRRVVSLRPLGGLLLVIAAIVVFFGPWWLRLARDLVSERQARARAEERADLATRVHDSVLQTLALIQRHADKPQQVVQLARAQERELRAWLFDGEVPGSGAREDKTFAAALKRIQNEVESAHGVEVDTVLVGDCPLDDRLRGLLAAGKEATVNAAKWSGTQLVSVYAEVEEESVSLFVRDRGRGFVEAEVPADRKGLAESVRGRIARLGGTAIVRSRAGEGTEVELCLPMVGRGHSTPSRT